MSLQEGHQVGFIFQLFVVPKKGWWFLSSELEGPEKFIQEEHFKMEEFHMWDWETG